MQTSVIVSGVETFSIVDYPGKLAAVVFLQGCPWRCPFCYNTALQEIGKPTGFLWDKFVEFLRERRGKLDAVVFSGGEPLVQNALEDAVDEVRALGYAVGLHTGGYRPDRLQRIIAKLGWIGFDIKAPFEKARYQSVTGTNHLAEVLQSLDIILKSGIDFECRTTCDPRLLNSEDIRRMADDIYARGVKKYFLQKYRPVPADTHTDDTACERIFADAALMEYLKGLFIDFEVRR